MESRKQGGIATSRMPRTMWTRCSPGMKGQAVWRFSWRGGSISAAKSATPVFPMPWAPEGVSADFGETDRGGAATVWNLR